VIEQPPAPDPRSLPHPVTFDVAYPERLSRWLIFVKWLLVIPQAVITYLLLQVLGLLSFVAWFAILFTGKYPESMHQFAVGTQRWAANVGAYIFLTRDEYPAFSFDAGAYPLTLDIPYPERQSRWRLFIRWFAIIPNQIVFTFVQIAWTITMFFAWFAILIIGRYPRGLFNFNVGVQRWWHRSSAYSYLLRDEYPPYSTRADARPGNEIVSAIIGFPLFVGMIALYALWVVFLFGSGTETVSVGPAALSQPGAIASTMPAADAGRVEITLEDFGSNVRLPGEPGTYFYFDVRFEKEGFGPAIYTPYLFFVDHCVSSSASTSPKEVEGEDFRWFWRDGVERSRIYFEGSPVNVCSLDYFTGFGFISFEFE
jgi:hypothetical protein